MHGDHQARHVISIHALREESDDTWDGAETFDRISIHALREESDMDPPTLQQMVRISIHTPLAGSDIPRMRRYCRPLAFQSTLPLRGVTL